MSGHEKDEEKFTDSIKESVPSTLQTSFVRLRQQEYYPFFERMHSLGVLMIIVSFLTLLTLLILDSGTLEELTWVELVAIAGALFGASWVVVISVAGLLWVIAEIINYTNRRGEDIDPAKGKFHFRIIEHLFKFISGSVMIVGFYQTLLADSFGNPIVTVALLIGIVGVFVFATGLVASGIIGLLHLIKTL